MDDVEWNLRKLGVERWRTRPLEEHCHKSKNKTFQERGIPTGWGDAIASKEQRHFCPLAAILENRRVTLFHKADFVWSQA
jgi:hypothetical protein